MSPGVASVSSNRQCMGKVTTSFTGQSENLHILVGICPLDNLYLAAKTPLLVGEVLVSFGDVLPETSKSSACWDMGENSHQTWLFDDSFYIPYS